MDRLILGRAIGDTWWELSPAWIGGALFGWLAALQVFSLGSERLSTLAKTSLVLGVLCLGGFLAAVKKRNLLSYGMSELGFAMGVSWAFVATQMGADPTTNMLALVGSVFLVASAFENMLEGARQQAEDQRRWAEEIVKERATKAKP